MPDNYLIPDSPVKRQKTQQGYRTVGKAHDSHQDALSHNTIPTQPLPRASQAPAPAASSSSGYSFSRLLGEIQGSASSSPYVTQPTQPLPNSPHRRTNSSTPTVQVQRSSPPTASSPTSEGASQAPSKDGPTTSGGLKRPGRGSRLAPPGTRFRPPPAVQRKPFVPIDLGDDDDDEDDVVDPPVDRGSDDETQPTAIKSTEFTRGGRGLDSSPNRVAESPRKEAIASDGSALFKNLTSSFLYSADKPSGTHAQQRSAVGGDMASAYANTSRVKPSPVARAKPASSVADDRPDLDLADILDFTVRSKVERMKKTLPQVSNRQLEAALRASRGNVEDALYQLVSQDDDDDEPVAVNGGLVDLTSSDIETNAAKPQARVQAKPTAKQQVKAPARTIQEKYLSSQRPKPGDASPAVAEPSKKRRLMKGRKSSASPVPSPSPEKPSVAPKKTIVIDSDDEDSAHATSDGDDDEAGPTQFEDRLLDFFNTCSVQDLADISNEKEAVATFVLSKKPFESIEQIRTVSDAQPTKSGKRSTKKPIGDKIVDVCWTMLEGYEAVDELVKKCEDIGKPLLEAMKEWGVNTDAAGQDGELALTNLEETHDSGIGTPSSNITDEEDEDLKPRKGAKSKFLKQPAIMSTDLQMKDYQLFGLNWLNMLWTRKLSCILADDMGLGKTCQVISFLAHLKETNVEGTHLVVVPGSTLENWMREFERFCPALTVLPYYGSQAERESFRMDWDNQVDEVDVIVTTYEMAVGNKTDNHFLRKYVEPVVCVFDEGHALKNSQSKRHQELMKIPADFRLLLTGTPLQNNLQELVSLLGFILPKLISESREELYNIFKFKATTKDADHAPLLSAERIKRARSMMTPFILRRKKHQVLKHMPAKHRRVEYCDMTPAQAELYRGEVNKTLEARANPQSAGKTVQSMTSLRFAALHPLLMRHHFDDKQLKRLARALQRSDEFGDNRPDQIEKYITEDLKGGDFGLHRFCLERADYLDRFVLRNDEWMASGKVQKLSELLERYVANGDKVLIFSQFTTMMNILEAVFETLAIKFMRLDGATNMALRQDIIDQFSADASIPVFMLSTKAGGAGINLACANKVVIFDSSFNPQDDIQAENRAHRVGQTREVEVVRLITRGTIEEQIHALGESKLKLDEQVAGVGGKATAEGKSAEKAEEAVAEMLLRGLEEEKANHKDEEPVALDSAKDEGKKTVVASPKKTASSPKKQVKKKATPNEGKDTKAGANKAKKGQGRQTDLKDAFKAGLRKAGLDVEE